MCLNILDSRASIAPPFLSSQIKKLLNFCSWKTAQSFIPFICQFRPHELKWSFS